VSRSEPGVRAEVDVRAAARDALHVALPRLRGRARIEEDLAVVPPVHGDADRLTQAIVALLVNAGEACPPGAPHANRIGLSVRSADGVVRVRVTDTGPGIPQTLRERIFEPFFTTRPGEATGLGLATCRGIVVSHGGRVLLESEVGRGSAFTIELPASRSGAAAVQLAQ
jgi:signal transduction histidine kinase